MTAAIRQFNFRFDMDLKSNDMKGKIQNTLVGLFKRFPILSNEVIFRIVVIVLMLPLIVLINKGKGECSCEDQIHDQRLISTSFKQDKQVQTYLKTKDNLVMCEARRQELLKKLEQKKKLLAAPSEI